MTVFGDPAEVLTGDVVDLLDFSQDGDADEDVRNVFAVRKHSLDQTTSGNAQGRDYFV